jgi:hypothetical protein
VREEDFPNISMIDSPKFLYSLYSILLPQKREKSIKVVVISRGEGG